MTLTAAAEDGISPVKSGAGVIGGPPMSQGPRRDWVSPGARLTQSCQEGERNRELQEQAAAEKSVAAVLLEQK